MKTSIAGLADALNINNFKSIQRWYYGQEIVPSRVGGGYSLDYSLVRSSNNCSPHRHHKVLVAALRQELC